MGQVTHEMVSEHPESVHIKWLDPKAPNGMIILYEVNYKRLGDLEVSMNTMLKLLNCVSINRFPPAFS